MSIYLYLATLNTTAATWEETSETIRGSAKSLADIDTTHLGPRVASAAGVFIEAWTTEIKRLETAARDHGDALRETALLFGTSDEDALERSQHLLTWTDRNTSPTVGDLQ